MGLSPQAADRSATRRRGGEKEYAVLGHQLFGGLRQRVAALVRAKFPGRLPTK